MIHISFVMVRNIFSGIFLFLSIHLSAQNFSGHWEGTLTQTGKTTTIHYKMDMVHDGKTVTGTSLSTMGNPPVQGAFQIVGSWDGNEFVFQEVMQTAPKDAAWCLKHARLKYQKNHEYDELVGHWEATGCVPGKIHLKRKNTIPTEVSQKEVVQENTALAKAILGRWTGHLKQSDRDYGFYYEVNLVETSNGTSYIISEGNGGRANHSLSWTLNEPAQTLSLNEIEVTSKTAERWRWCIKKGTLNLKKDDHKYYLEGDWSGYLEDFDSNNSKGQCSPGKIYLEKPIVKKQELSHIKNYQSNVETSTQQKGRDIKIVRTINVSKPKIKLKVWDNGSVDGDRITVFLNEKQLLHNYRVSKNKRTIPVQLNKETNFLILHAENLGDITPNTVAVSVHDGITEQILILSSNLEESGAVMIKQFKVD